MVVANDSLAGRQWRNRVRGIMRKFQETVQVGILGLQIEGSVSLARSRRLHDELLTCCP